MPYSDKTAQRKAVAEAKRRERARKKRAKDAAAGLTPPGYDASNRLLNEELKFRSIADAIHACEIAVEIVARDSRESSATVARTILQAASVAAKMHERRDVERIEEMERKLAAALGNESND